MNAAGKIVSINNKVNFIDAPTDCYNCFLETYTYFYYIYRKLKEPLNTLNTDNTCTGYVDTTTSIHPFLDPILTIPKLFIFFNSIEVDSLIGLDSEKSFDISISIFANSMPLLVFLNRTSAAASNVR